MLDYFVVSEGLAQAWAIVTACVIGDAGFGPHSPVRLIVKANTRTLMVRQLKVPIGFGADLPFGPMPKTGCPRALCRHQGTESAALCEGIAAHEADGETKNKLSDIQRDATSDVLLQSSVALLSSHKGDGGDNYDNNDARSLVELGRDYNCRIDTIEDELCAVEGLEGIQAQARKGKTSGAHFCWKPAMGDDTAGAAKTTSVSRAGGGPPSG